MSTSEIAKLESRWRENPNGLTFAPLAEAYRKQKDPQRALEILLPGLGKHPDYIPANIVLGRCHWDLNDLPAAERAFTHVLGLDGENVIALKALADITERLARYDEAERWLDALLAVDRSNDEARAQLTRVREFQRQQAEGSAAVPEAAGAAAETVEAPPPVIELPAVETPAPVEPMPAPEAFEPAPEPPALEEVTSVEYIGWVARPDEVAGTIAPLRLEDLEPTQASEPAAESPDELAVAFEPPEPAAHSAPLPEVDAFGFEQSEDIILNVSGQTEYQTPSAVDDLMAHVAGTPSGIDDLRRDLAPEEPITSALPGFVPRAQESAAEPEAEPEPELPNQNGFEPPAVASLFGRTADFYALEEPPARPEPALRQISEEGRGAPEPVAEAASSPEPSTTPESGPEPAAPEPEPAVLGSRESAAEPEDAPAVAEPELVVTETMAEVFLRQGHIAEAITVYRELVRRGPGTEHVHGRLADLESRLMAAAAPPPRPAYAARDTGGQSVAAFFQTLLQARPEDAAPRWPARPEASAAAPEPPPEEAPATRPAGEPLSLGSVFGDEPPPVAPAVGRPSGETAAPGTAGGGSFDDFFGAPPGKPAAAPRPSAAAPQGRSGDDLDQFHAWLESLKR
jgi:tetratricopeptide (TPR) repeat protein